LVDFREAVARALGFNTSSLSVPEERIHARLQDLVQARRSHSPKASQSDSSVREGADTIGVRYMGSRLASSPLPLPPSEWAPHSSRRDSLPRRRSKARR
ncbi:hypothetical protein chiPu_0029692, partial [Chiloscyllium punctatum]|nr:hypothetical protein [Chiloscyllium punctatum]